MQMTIFSDFSLGNNNNVQQEEELPEGDEIKRRTNQQMTMFSNFTLGANNNSSTSLE